MYELPSIKWQRNTRKHYLPEKRVSTDGAVECVDDPPVYGQHSEFVERYMKPRSCINAVDIVNPVVVNLLEPLLSISDKILQVFSIEKSQIAMHAYPQDQTHNMFEGVLQLGHHLY